MRPSGRAMLRGSSDIPTIQTTGNSTVEPIAIQRSWRRIWLPTFRRRPDPVRVWAMGLTSTRETTTTGVVMAGGSPTRAGWSEAGDPWRSRVERRGGPRQAVCSQGDDKQDEELEDGERS